MKRDYRLYIDDILEATHKIEEYTRNLTYEQFSKDYKTIDAVIRNFTIIGEAAKHIPSSIRKKYRDIPWKDMAGMRDILVHEYFGVRVDIVWETIKKRLPQLQPLIESMLRQIDGETREK
ncbi:DUF86 domain-containing protein [Candidatus Acetothermia bacterium]|nr:DUF86 domain-containing protein [Candidatus Acetothermia bacterium]